MNKDDEELKKLIQSLDSHYIEDAGFTARVVGALPAPRSAASVRRLALLGMASALSLFLMAVLGGRELWQAVAVCIQRLTVDPVYTIGMHEYSLGTLLAICGGLLVSAWLAVGSLRSKQF